MASLLNLLIVDDQPDNLHSLATILSGEGYSIRKATSGQVALSTVRYQPPNLILLDVRMPDMDGYEVCRQLKADPATAEIPVIFLSALDEVQDKVRGFEVGGADYITKPFHATEVLARIRYQLTLQQQQQQLQRFNTDLEQQIKTHTAELQAAFDFEALLKRITEHIRDSLDEKQIIQTAIEELAIALDVLSCNASIYHDSRRLATVQYEHSQDGLSYVGRTLDLDQFPEIYQPLHQGGTLQFCSASNYDRGQVALLACPIRDGQEILGDVWLVRSAEDSFREQEVRLVQQVANQCAIALRQAHLYAAAQRQVEDLGRLNRLKDDFLSTISHELRTPMSNIKVTIGLFEMILRQVEFSEEQTARLEKYLRILKEESNREIKLINDLLTLSRLDEEMDYSKNSPVDLQTWIPYIADSFQERLQKQQQQLIIQVPRGLPYLLTDSSHLQHILTELLTNACKYTPVGGEITISVSLNVVERSLVAQGYRSARVAVAPASHFWLQVTNTGIEIPETEHDRIFDKFYRIPNQDPWKYGGVGLGLTLVHKLVKCLGGEIWVESGNGQTTFHLQLPLKEML
ncbi:MAG: response regulator [Leptolyngbyaceae cyanobacterium bins.59]|nr:response regulator [Leptolyngbyaceae cyanobacterium bins.59]